MKPAGYQALIQRYGLPVPPHHRSSYIVEKGRRRTVVEGGREVHLYPPVYRPEDTLVGHLEFALKHEGVNLEILRCLFETIGDREVAEIVRYVRENPTGRYARRMWFLYEYLTGRRLPLPDLSRGSYVGVLDPTGYVTGPPVRSRRHRVVDNLLGNPKFCPVVRKTEVLKDYKKSRRKTHCFSGGMNGESVC